MPPIELLPRGSKLGEGWLFPGELKSASIFAPDPVWGPGWLNPASPGITTSIDLENVLPPPLGPPPKRVAIKFLPASAIVVFAFLTTAFADFWVLLLLLWEPLLFPLPPIFPFLCVPPVTEPKLSPVSIVP